MNTAELRRAARARPGVDPELFFPPTPKSESHPGWEYLAHVEFAKEICRRCPVRAACLENNLDVPHGVFGGVDEVERTRLRRAANLRPRNSSCGTLVPVAS